MTPVSPEEVASVIKGLKAKNSLDYYDMNAKILKQVYDIVAEPLSVIINNCIAEGVFPKALKVSKIVPVYKKGDASDLGNYRPIAISPVLSKVFESILKHRLLNFLESDQIFSVRQYGFRGGRSTVSAVLKLIEDAVAGFDRGHSTHVTLCDLSKAFDCVVPELLLRKLEGYGIRGIPWRLFHSYLTERSQYVDYNNQKSAVVSQSIGVPQGSVLGPILFILFINDLPSFVTRASTLLFADDTTLYTSCRQVGEARDENAAAFGEATSWFLANKLHLNSSKTQAITLTTDKRLPYQEPVCLLGIRLDQRLTWCSHINQVCNRVSSGLYALRRLVALVSDEVLRTAYYSMIHAHLSYGILVWGESSELNKAFILQKKAIRMMVKRGPREHCREWFRHLKILTLPCIYIYATCAHIHTYASSLPTPADIHGYETRGRGLLSIPASRTCISEKNKINFKLYNALPSDIKSLTLGEFKKQLRDVLVVEAFYTVNEFLSFRFMS